MKKLFIAACIAFLGLYTISAQTGQSLLAEIDALVSFPEADYSAEYTVTQNRPGRGTTVTSMAMFRRDAEEKYLILITSPETDKGKGYLKIGNNLWLYDPESRRFTVTSAKDRFQNSNARNSDFTQSTLAADYRIVSQHEEQLGVYATRVLELEATNDSVTYPAMKIWVDENNLVRKTEDYSLSGQLMRTTAIPRYQALNGRFVPIQVVIIDALAGRVVNGQFQNERTIISVSNPSLGTVPDLTFTQAFLERTSR